MNRLQPSVLNHKYNSKMTVDNEIDYSIKYVEEIYKKSNKFVSMVVGVVGDNRYVFPFQTTDSKDKYEQAEVIKQIFRKLKITRLIFMGEIWMVKTHKEMYSDSIVPSKHPAREEGVLITVSDKDGTSKSALLPISRLDDEVILGVPVMTPNGDVKDNLFGDIFKEEK